MLPGRTFTHGPVSPTPTPVHNIIRPDTRPDIEWLREAILEDRDVIKELVQEDLPYQSRYRPPGDDLSHRGVYVCPATCPCFGRFDSDRRPYSLLPQLRVSVTAATHQFYNNAGMLTVGITGVSVSGQRAIDPVPPDQNILNVGNLLNVHKTFGPLRNSYQLIYFTIKIGDGGANGGSFSRNTDNTRCYIHINSEQLGRFCKERETAIERELEEHKQQHGADSAVSPAASAYVVPNSSKVNSATNSGSSHVSIWSVDLILFTDTGTVYVFLFDNTNDCVLKFQRFPVTELISMNLGNDLLPDEWNVSFEDEHDASVFGLFVSSRKRHPTVWNRSTTSTSPVTTPSVAAWPSSRSLQMLAEARARCGPNAVINQPTTQTVSHSSSLSVDQLSDQPHQHSSLQSSIQSNNPYNSQSEEEMFQLGTSQPFPPRPCLRQQAEFSPVMMRNHATTTIATITGHTSNTIDVVGSTNMHDNKIIPNTSEQPENAELLFKTLQLSLTMIPVYRQPELQLTAHLIGRGASGCGVFEGFLHLFEQKKVPVAFKAIRISTAISEPNAHNQLPPSSESKEDINLRLSEQIIHDLKREAICTEHGRHPLIVKLLGVGVWQPENQPLSHGLILEFCDGYDLRRHLDSSEMSGQALTPEQCVHCIDHVMSALAHLHSKQLVHGDVKSANVLVQSVNSDRDRALPWSKKELRFKLADFGSVRLSQEILALDTSSDLSIMKSSTRTRGTLAYTPLDGEYGTRTADVYALGVLMAECLLRKAPDHGRKTGPSLLPFDDDDFLVIGDTRNKPLATLVRDCMNQNSKERPTMADVKLRWNMCTPVDMRDSQQSQSTEILKSRGIKPDHLKSLLFTYAKKITSHFRYGTAVFSSKEFVTAYDLVFDACIHDQSEFCYNSHTQCLVELLVDDVEALQQALSVHNDFLLMKQFVDTWNLFKVTSACLGKIFLFLERFYIPNTTHAMLLQDKASLIFFNEVLCPFYTPLKLAMATHPVQQPDLEWPSEIVLREFHVRISKLDALRGCLLFSPLRRVPIFQPQNNPSINP